MMRPISRLRAPATSRLLALQPTPLTHSSAIRALSSTATTTSSSQPAPLPPQPTPISTPSPLPTTASIASSASPAPTTVAQRFTSPHTYHVSRTPSHNLPVYHEKRSGGTNKFTAIRHVAGDFKQLQADIVSELGFDSERVKIKQLAGHINVKGWHKETITKWLESKGF